MQVIPTATEGLRREFRVVVPASDLAERLAGELEGLRAKARINGFRPGKVPLAHLRKLYGRSVMADVLQTTMTEANRRIVEEGSFRLAMEPKVTMPEDQAVVERALQAEGDLEYTVAVEVLPKVEAADLSDVRLEREVAEVDEADVTAAIERMAAGQRAFAEKDGPAATGDRVTIDFVGTIGGEPFEGGAGQDVKVEIGSGGFIPGFEEQLIGARAGEERAVEATFPEGYAAEALAGKAASFATKVNLVETPGELTIDDELAKGFGLESLDALRVAVRERMAADYAGHSRRRLKRKLLDALDAKHAFELPPTLVEQEFDGIWRNVTGDMERAGKSFADEDTTEEGAREEYRRIAERRVRLGLVLAEVGEREKVEVTDDEVTAALVERARGFRGQEQRVWDYYRQNPQALAELRAPIFEEKVVDKLLETIAIEDRTVPKEALLAEDDDEAPAGSPATVGALDPSPAA